MLLSNPGYRAYESYAINRLSEYIQENACEQIPESEALLRRGCESFGKTLFEVSKPKLRALVSQQTVRLNFLLFSIYQTEITPSFLEKRYQFNSIGVFRRFYTYEIEEF